METLRSWAWTSASQEEGMSEASQGMTEPRWIGPEHGWAVVRESAEESCFEGWVKVCGPEGKGGCCRQTCVEGSDTVAGALEQDRAGSWAGCGRSSQGSLGHWSWGSCSGMSFPQLSGWSLGWTCSPALGFVVTSCALVSRGRFPLRTGSGLKRTNCGWCGGETPAW